MTKAAASAAIAELPREEQLELVQEVWDRLAPEVDLELTPELRLMLRERLREARENPDSGTPWDVVRERLLASFNEADR